ncbi:MAG: CsbD family protein [Acidimicrobiales bacterium]
MTNTDKLKGKAKEAAGDLTGDSALKREGKVDRAIGSVRDAVDKAGDKVKDAVRDRRR